MREKYAGYTINGTEITGECANPALKRLNYLNSRDTALEVSIAR